MRVLLTVHQFFPEYRTGTEVLTLGVARELRRRGHHVEVFAAHPVATRPDDAQRLQLDSFDGFRVHRYLHGGPPDGDYIPPQQLDYADPGAARSFTHVLRGFRPDWVHCFHLARLGTGVVDAAREARVHLSYTPTDFWLLCPMAQMTLPDGRLCGGPKASGGNCIRHFAQVSQAPRLATLGHRLPAAIFDAAGSILRRLPPTVPGVVSDAIAVAKRPRALAKRLAAFERIFAPTAVLRERLLAYGAHPARVLQCGYGLEGPAGQPDLPDPGGRPLRIGFIGTLSPHKGCHTLLEAVTTLPEGLVETRVHGRQDEFPSYVARLRALAGDRADVVFLPPFDNARIGEVLAQLDCLVVPSAWYENTPLVVLSALAARRPVLASAVPGIAETIQDRHNGRLFPPGSADGLANVLRDLAADPSAVVRMAASCKPPKTLPAYVDDLLAGMALQET